MYKLFSPILFSKPMSQLLAVLNQISNTDEKLDLCCITYLFGW